MSKPIPRNLTWQELCKQIEIYHKSSLKSNSSHRVQDTAKELNYSVGKVSEYLQLALWCRTDPSIERFKEVVEARDYMKKKKMELRTRL